MDVNANVDIGQNLTGLIERLAQQIGTTTDKVFPWYVQQAYLEGVTTLIALLCAFFVVGAILLWSLKRAKFGNGPTVADIALVFSGFSMFVVILGVPLEGIDASRKMLNPNYYAMKSFTRDIGRMAGR